MSKLTVIDPQLLEELGEVVVEVLDGMVDSSIADGHVPVAQGLEGQMIEASVPILSQPEHTLTIWVTGNLALGMAAALLGDEPAELDAEDACATVSELVNLFGGTVKTLLAEETSLGIPETTIKSTEAVEIPDDTLQIDHLLGQFQIRLSQ